MKFKPVLGEVLEEIQPTKEERNALLKEVRAFVSGLNAELRKSKVRAKAVLGGSYAKDTWLRGDYDVDIFVKFALSYKDGEMSNLLEKALKKWKPERVHGSRDYFWVKNTITFEVIPVLDIKKPSDARNVTDFSPRHVEWVNREGKRLKDDIRLTKKFCKAAKCYGAESYIRGFSGHVVDIITIYYRGFLPLLKAAAKWKPKVVLDYYKKHRGRALLVLNKSKTQGPLVVVDPVQPERNAAAALTGENFGRFVAAAKQFIKSPGKRFFEEQPVDYEKLAKKGHLVKARVRTLDAKEDVAGTKFVRAFEFVRQRLEEFGVIDAGWEWDRKERGVWWFVVRREKLPERKEHRGPPVGMKGAVKEFRKKYKSTFTRKGYVWTKVRRNARTPEQAVKSAVKDEYVKSRVKGVRL